MTVTDVDRDVPIRREEEEGDPLMREADELFDEGFRYPYSFLSRSPREEGILQRPEIQILLDVFEEGDDIVVEAEAPGLRKEDLNVTIDNDVLTISGEKRRRDKLQKADYYRRERTTGRFSRSIRIPGIDRDQVTATFRDGLLEVRLPKTEESRKRKRSIEIEG